MIIAVDGYEANVTERVGIGRYAFEILNHLYGILENSRNNRKNFSVRVYLPDSPVSDMPREREWWKYRIIPMVRFWTFIGLPFGLLRDQPRADVIFSPTHYIPRFTQIARVCAVMDLSYLNYPDMFRLKDLLQLKHWTEYSVRHAKRILTISEFSRNAIIKAYRIPNQRISVTYPGLKSDKSNISMEDNTQVLCKYGIPRHYILSVGTIQPRKNFLRLIEGFSVFLRLNRQKFGEINLVIVGKKGWMYEDIISSPVKFGVGNCVRFLDYVPDCDLPVLYKNALCFVLPSLYEGFGLPVLEAMSYSCPVVVSNISSLPEIAGKAGIYIDPNDTASISAGLLSAVRERNLKQGKWRIAKGLAQVSKFTWEKAAIQTLEVLEEASRTEKS